jgi:hypothetical protein
MNLSVPFGGSVKRQQKNRRFWRIDDMPRNYSYCAAQSSAGVQNMRVQAIAILLLCLTSAPAMSRSLGGTGNDELGPCRTFLEVADGTPAEKRRAAAASAGTWLDQGYCAGAIQVARNAAAVLVPAIRSCPPTEAPLSQVIRVVVTYMQAHPESLHEDLEILAWKAMKEAWPCKQ